MKKHEKLFVRARVSAQTSETSPNLNSQIALVTHNDTFILRAKKAGDRKRQTKHHRKRIFIYLFVN